MRLGLEIKHIFCISIIQIFLMQAAIADNSSNKVPVFALDGATSISVETEKPLYAIAGAVASLERENDAISIEVETSGLPAGAYTNWWMIFNYPSHCAAVACQLIDFFNPATGATLLWAAGRIIDSAEAEFKATLSEGEIPGQLFFGPGLTNATGAQVKYVIKWHGPASSDPDILYTQLHDIADANCETSPLPGLTGLGRCPDLQSSDMFIP